MADLDPNLRAQAAAPGNPSRGRLLHAVGFGAMALLTVWLTLDAPGLVWDETIYMGFAKEYIDWFQHWGSGAFTPEAIEWAWGKGQVHPPLGKLGLALGIKLFHPTFPNCPELDVRAIRLASACWFALLTGVAFWWMAKAFGECAGALSALALMLTPRLFGHAHFGTLDMPMAALWFVAVALFSQVGRSRVWVWAAAIALAAAGLTKINAAFIPLVLVPYAVWRLRRRAVVPIIVLCVVPLLAFFALWPHMWVDTWQHLWHYVTDKASRMHVEAYYGGRAFAKSSPAWHYPLVLTLVTVPLPFLAAAAFASIRGLKRRDPTIVLLVANASLVLGVACLPFVPKYDGVRLFLPAFPFVACLAGVGLSAALAWVRSHAASRRWLPWAVGACLFGPAAAEVVHLHPFQLSYYNEAVGFLAGAGGLGFEPTYWGDTLAKDTVEFLNRTCAPGDKVAFFPVGSYVPSTHQNVTMDLRPDVQIVDYESREWRYLVLVSRYGKFDDHAWSIHRGHEPVFSVKRWGVKLCSVYRE